MKTKHAAESLKDKLLFTLYIVLGVLGILSLSVCVCTGLKVEIAGTLHELGTNGWSVGIMVVLLLGVLVLAGYLFFRLWRNGDEETDYEYVPVQKIASGSVMISVEVIEMIVNMALGSQAALDHLEISPVSHGRAISVKVYMTLRKGLQIPQVTMELQGSIKNFIEENCGIAVKDVTIMVAHIDVSGAKQGPIRQAPPRAMEAPKQDTGTDTSDAVWVEGTSEGEGWEGEISGFSEDMPEEEKDGEEDGEEDGKEV